MRNRGEGPFGNIRRKGERERGETSGSIIKANEEEVNPHPQTRRWSKGAFVNAGDRAPPLPGLAAFASSPPCPCRRRLPRRRDPAVGAAARSSRLDRVARDIHRGRRPFRTAVVPAVVSLPPRWPTTFAHSPRSSPAATPARTRTASETSSGHDHDRSYYYYHYYTSTRRTTASTA